MNKAAKFIVATLLSIMVLAASSPISALTQQSGSVGIEGTVPGSPPTQAAVITTPKNGQVFTAVPITVAGLCKTGLLVEIYKNNVFAGSVICASGSFSMKIDLFSGRNDLIAKVYDNLNQKGPDSNKVTVTFNNNQPNTGPAISLTTEYAKRGANPGSILSWPISISGGKSPYALSIDWGDKNSIDLISRQAAGSFDITHTYNQSGIYNVTIRATDANGSTSFLQVVAISNGPVTPASHARSTSNESEAAITVPVLFFWLSIGSVIPLFIVSFWLGKKHQLQKTRDKLRRGERPF